MRNKSFNDIKHKAARQMSKVERLGKDHFDWNIDDEADLDFLMKNYDVEVIGHMITRTFRPGFNVRYCKNKTVRDIYYAHGHTVFRRGLNDDQVAACERVGLKVVPRLVRVRRKRRNR